MISLYYCRAEERNVFIKKTLSEITGREAEIMRTSFGKPYLQGNPVYFSVSHSGGICVLAVSSLPVGADVELYCGKNRSAVLRSFSGRECAEITCERDFLMHWTAREAYVKLSGGRIWDYVKRLEFFCGKLYIDGSPAEENIVFCEEFGAVTAVCGKDARFCVKTI